MRSLIIILVLVLSACASLQKPDPIGNFTKIEIMELGGITGGIPMRIFYPDGRIKELGIPMQLELESQAELEELLPQIKALEPCNTGLIGEVGRSLTFMSPEDTLRFTWIHNARDRSNASHDAIYRKLSSLSAVLTSP